MANRYSSDWILSRSCNAGHTRYISTSFGLPLSRKEGLLYIASTSTPPNQSQYSNTSHVTPENCSTLYIFTILVSLFSLGRPRKPEDCLIVEEAGIPSWLTLLRGTRSIIEFSHTALLSGPPGPMFQNELRRVQLREVPSYNRSVEEKQLEGLQRTISRATTDQRTLKTYTEVIEELRKSYIVLHNNPHTYEFTDAFIWVLRVSDEYLQLLNKQIQESLCTFAFFSVVVYQLSSHWWIEGWGRNLIAQIDLLLDEEHRSWIQWPLEQIHLDRKSGRPD